MFIKCVLNCERPAKCIPLTEDWLKKKKKKKEQIPPGFVFYLFPQLIISEQSDFTVLSLELALHLQSYRRMQRGDGGVSEQAATAPDGWGAACVIPHPPGQGVNKHRTNTDQMDRPAESIGGFSSQRGKAIAEIISLNNTDGGEGMVRGSWAKRAGSKHTLWVLSSILEVKKYNKSFSILSTK